MCACSFMTLRIFLNHRMKYVALFSAHYTFLHCIFILNYKHLIYKARFLNLVKPTQNILITKAKKYFFQ
ncbi:hypothetical protein GLOIN_2v1561690 [Rhizophagus irregularis DAOM 181602=DAOM 197198]|uniref:Uncharacterized protein n=1 Tax=Rhizophagus irregularis (strain DAOM 181602 / DAOM 197198 / MUCL 43194) TaxID=747089 RepID=A0A2P4QDL2_RHIID|nr:hypothetical protein GLOIN_2v1561690 [Rhizophagus irregularis DAOM 181602=DAOM 197198]POG75721.1 hypothetical protein GLOIN_2v1561690 [Rhizophagus irregularis DAOM 181602=DAOM 197198]GET67385.1 hypothetical protein GLOIN_2v1561690 [Rhizophagus irregularis DAOM 181602=DAOM 197198]|eukprot:XP_025182587.1 hypothetical protein GLOIN_2v1561690 [Rhizophagus irregularis DAOM 181602=DAOM 197198]